MNIQHRKIKQQLVIGSLALVFGSISLSACGDGNGSPAQAYCDKVKALGSIKMRLSNVDPTNFPASIAVFGELTTSLKDVADMAPEEIKGDWQGMATAIAGMTELMKPLAEVDLADPSKITPEVLAKVKEMGPKMEGLGANIDEVGERIDVSTKSTCGFVLGV